MAQKKAGGSTRNGRDSHSQRLGIKRYGSEHVIPGNILCRQRGTQWHPGSGVGMGKDHTIFAIVEGVVEFKHKANGRIYISVKPQAHPQALVAAE
jgi:large subunit ribosomal protein L27